MTTQITTSVKSPAKKTVNRKKKIVTAQDRKVAGQFIAAIAAGFLPVAAYVIAHYEMVNNQYLGILVAAALLFSAPTLVAWAEKWCGNRYKAIGFAVLLEGVSIFSHIPTLSYSGLAVLVLINCHSAYNLYGARKPVAKKVAKKSTAVTVV